MASKALSKIKSGKPAFSLISDEKFRQMNAALVKLRGKGKARGLEAALVGTTIDLQAGDLVFAPEAFPSPALAGGGATVFAAVGNGGGHLLTSAGAALGLRTAGGSGVVVAFADPSVPHREGWRNALLLAGPQRLPILFVLLPGRGSHSARATAVIASEAAQAGIITIPVDTGDTVAMYRVAFESLARARRRSSATLIVCTTFALDERQGMKRAPDDPIIRMRAYLQARGIRRTPETV